MLRQLRRVIDGDEKLKLAVGQVLAGNTDGFASAVAVTGDLTCDSVASFAIGAAKVTSAMIGTGAVTSAKIGASAITGGKLGYTPFNVHISCSVAAATSAFASVTCTSNARLLGIWIAEVSGTPVFSGFRWYASMAASGSLAINLINSNPSTDTVAYMFRGVVIEP